MTALGTASSAGVVPAAVGAVQPVGERPDKSLELGARHPVELGDAVEHPAVTFGEVQRSVATLPLVQPVEVVAGLLLSGPVLGLVRCQVGGDCLGRGEQSEVAVDGLWGGLGRGAGQGGGVLAGQAPRRQRPSDIGHLVEGLGASGTVPGLARGAARLATKRLGGGGLAGPEPPQSNRDPGFEPVEHSPGGADAGSEVAEPAPVQDRHIDALDC